MKKSELMVILLVICAAAFFPACDSGSSGGGGSEARALGNSLVLSGNVTQTFNTSTAEITGYTNPDSHDYVLLDESTDDLYATDTNEAGATDVNINYSGTTHLDNLYSAAGGGITSSNSSAQVTSVILEDSTTGDDLNNGEFSSSLAKWYYYMYSSADTVLDGTYEDEDEKTYTMDDLKLFAGWNEMVCETSDGIDFTYYGATLSNPKWTYMDNSGE